MTRINFAAIMIGLAAATISMRDQPDTSEGLLLGLRQQIREGNDLLVERSFYLGLSHFLDESHSPSAEESASQKVANGLFELLTEETLEARIVGLEIDLATSDYEWEYATADDRPGLPVLLYLNVLFDVPEEHADDVRTMIEDEDGGTLTFARIGHIRILEMGGLEITED